MLGLIARRVLTLVPIMLIVSFGVFMLSALLPGDPAVTLAGGESATPERIAEITEQLRLDDPLVERYGRWLGDAVRFDFGSSLFVGDRITVWQEIKTRLPVTASLAFAALGFGLLIGVPIGIVSGMKPGRTIDRIGVSGTSIGLAIPNFFVAMLLIVVLARGRDPFFPTSGFNRLSEGIGPWLKTVTLPALALGLVSASSVARQLRAALIDVMGSNYVRTAWATGQPPLRVVGKYALKNAGIPAVTVVALQLTFLLGGTVIIEQLFGIPGLGSYLIRALTSQDVPVIQGVVLFFVISNVTINLLLDITYGFLNPKVRVT
jgi:peptide/nickel transport system permease protein